MTNAIDKGKTKPFLLSEQVRNILKKQGFSTVFNYADYKIFKRQCKNTFNQANAIARLFISEATPDQNDFNQYIF